MSLEKPVVAFAVDGPREIITDKKDGLLVESDSVEELAQAITTVLENPDLAGRLGKMGRATVISRFSAKTFVGRISKVYDEITGSPLPAEGETG
jgi:glycosyltransferase involved in cell wall biosynthesis